MKILTSIVLLVILSACKSNESNAVSNLPENPFDLPPSESVNGSETEIENYKIEIKWEHPGTRQDGSNLESSEISKFIIHYGQDANNLDKKVVVSDAVNLSQVIELPESGRWYISMSTVDGEGLESELSGLEDINICKNVICNG